MFRVGVPHTVLERPELAEHLKRRDGRYYYRRRVPSDLVAAYGKREIQQALDTANIKEATKLARKVAVGFDEIFDRLRKEAAAPAYQPIIVSTESMTAYDRGQLEHDEESNALAAQEEAEQEAREQRIEEMKEAVRAILAESHPATAPIPATAALEVLVNPNPQATPKQPALDNSSGLPELIRLWTTAKKPDVATVDRMHTIVSRFFDAVNGRPSVRSIRRQHVLDFQTHLAGLGIAASTVRNQIAHFRALLATAVNAGLIESNPAANVHTEVVRSPKTARIAFSKSDLAAIFASPIYAEGVKAKAAGGEAAYWLPLLGLFTGSRLEELGQLHPTDVREETYDDAHGKEQTVAVIYLTEESEGQGLKNSASIRRIPIHPALIECGFLKYVASQKGTRLFPMLKADKYGRETAAFSRWFGKYLREHCGITDKRKVFHSFRHWFKDAMREAAVHEDVSDALSGHTNGSTSRNYGGSYYPLRPLVEAMSKYRISGLKLPKK